VGYDSASMDNRIMTFRRNEASSSSTVKDTSIREYEKRIPLLIIVGYYLVHLADGKLCCMLYLPVKCFAIFLSYQ
jgi:hypothetical protein